MKFFPSLILSLFLLFFVPSLSFASIIKEVHLSVSCKGTLADASSESSIDCNSTVQLKPKTSLTVEAQCYTGTKDSEEGHTKQSWENISYYWNATGVTGASTTESDNTSSTYEVTLPNSTLTGSISIVCSDNTVSDDTGRSTCDEAHYPCSYGYQEFNFSVTKKTYSLTFSNILNNVGSYLNLGSGLGSSTLTDADGDGTMSSDDCNDNDPAVHESTTWYIDSDGDTYGTTATTQEDCSQPTGYVSNSTDCDDTTDSGSVIHPGATETCGDSTDQDCDGLDTACSVEEDPDDDDDTVLDESDNCPDLANTDQLDTDSDKMGDVCDDDDDGDGVADAGDTFTVDVYESVDLDNDGTGDNADTDDDSDQILDVVDNCPLVANADQADTDDDSIGNLCDAETGESATTPSSSSGGCSCNLLDHQKNQSSTPISQNMLSLLILISIGFVSSLRRQGSRNS